MYLQRIVSFVVTSRGVLGRSWKGAFVKR
ncbi:Protein of unknown function [Pyronema omphalodes CBS 100304]|uniref:Uncharacterized protein n=1 Tax=Pyronema omphalodes (strain CBS 100304) TaxID=1076935 RepID=U4LVA4_PYROM|nr:Protein of unknown function [Pyronema omphalodes CBS 100304]